MVRQRAEHVGLVALLLVWLLGPLDRVFGLRRLFPCNHVVFARRAAAGPA
jgi:hypothetical protein